MGIAELIDRGIKAYVAGRVGEALRCFQEALELDPGNPKARSYLHLIRGAAPGEPPAPSAPAGPPAAEAIVAAVGLPDRRKGPPAAGPSPWDDGPVAPALIELEPDGGLDLVAVAETSDVRPLVPDGAPPARSAPAAPDPSRRDVDVWLRAARELFQLGDFSGSLELIEKVLQRDPNHGEAREYLRQNEATLIAMYESKLGPRDGVPRLAIQPEEIMWLNLDHRAGFLLAQIDGIVDYDALFAISGLPRLDTARILANLIADGVIATARR